MLCCAALAAGLPSGDAISNRYQLLIPAVLAGSLALGGTFSCGARSALRTADLCAIEGQQRPCRDVCGEGTQTCEEGVWQRCVVESTERACQNTCGEGVEICEESAWGECQVEPVHVECENDCGVGEQVCENDRWGACEVEPVARTCSTACGDGLEWCREGSWLPCDAPQPRPPRLHTIVRDFHVSHIDFESDSIPPTRQYAQVEEFLGPDGTPVRSPRAISIASDESFYEWYHDVEGVNLSTEVDLQLERSTAGNALFEYRDTAFFPIDDELFGNEGFNHNFHFTLQASTQFRYIGGETFIFTGDDDLWVFINRRLAIDLGGLHQSLQGRVDLDTIAASHGLEIGEVYPLHIFFAERHSIDSNFTIETSIAGPPECD